MTTTNSIYQIKESEIAYVIQALDDAFMYLETNCDGMSTDSLWQALGLMHNLKSAETGELYWDPKNWKPGTDRLSRLSTCDTDYFD